MSEYDRIGAAWERDRHLRAASRRRPRKITARMLIELLEDLRRETLDSRFEAAINAVHDNDLLNDEGGWERNQSSYAGEPTGSFAVYPAVERMVCAGMSIRLACATYVLDYVATGTTFDAAVAQVRRAYERHRRLVVTEPSGSCHTV